MCRSRRFCQRGSNFDDFFSFLVDEGREDQNTTISEPSLARQLNAIYHLNGVLLVSRYWPNIECWHGSFVMFRGSGPVLLRNPKFLNFCDFYWGGGGGGRGLGLTCILAGL